ncbi:unnamed protein product [Rotaria sordida]|uniref:Uncharacterized protein n=1 Tax=Rotaria sordida TaxID=392033 RepID=A0A815ECJ4_9BILA|nr:unnamed protein product [Rotaria sordida]CAF3876643.1 unnamed protein product [Rotaria sordida]
MLFMINRFSVIAQVFIPLDEQLKRYNVKLLRTNCNRNNEDPVEAAVEISLNNRTLKILSTAPIPLTRAACDSKSESEAYTTDENDI